MVPDKSALNWSKSPVPLPPDLMNLPTIQAEPWLQVSTDNLFLEGPAFDRQGNFFITTPRAGYVFKITPRKKITTVFRDKNVSVCGSAFHQDGRLFIVCMSGEMLILNPDGSENYRFFPRYQGDKMPMNDLVFDSQGNIYVTHFVGSIVDPCGGVFRILAGTETVQPVVEGLALPNGISLSPEGNVLWVAEVTRNRILRISLLEDGLTVNPIAGIVYAYYSSGAPGGPDSNKVDSEGNLYQCICFQGRIVVLNKYGIPIANIVIPGRDEGKFLNSGNMAFRPGTSEGYIATSGEGGAWIFKFKGPVKGLSLYSHR